MTNHTRLIIPVVSSPIGALLAAAGVAQWLDNLGHDITGQKIDVQIANAGHSIIVSTPVHLTPEQVQAKHYHDPPMSWILTAKNGPPPAGVRVFNYEEERQRNSCYFERLKQLRKQGVSIKNLPHEEQNALREQAPSPEWPVAAMINQMSALNAYNKAIERWIACRPVYPELAAIIWTMCSGAPGAFEAAQRKWEALAKRHGLEKGSLPALQVVNPEQGKGANRPKADANIAPGGLEGFWLLEYFKFAGLYLAAAPRTVQGRKDRKVYVVIPASGGLSLHWHRNVFKEFQGTFWASSAIKMDVQAVLRYTLEMLKQWEGAQISSGPQRRTSDFVDGFAVASFKDLGSAVAVLNVATLRLPDWVDWPRDPARAHRLREMLAEHQRITAALEEQYGAEEQLLRDYREFLSSRDPELTAFFDFTAGYAAHIISKLNKRQPVICFSADNLKEVMMATDERRSEDKKLVRIVETPGFRNIATAIRRSTVIPQFQKAKGVNTPYDVRYGLADELRRKARNEREFISALSEFMQQYNQENKRVYAREKRQRADITTQDITDIVRLIDDYGALTVANLLIAFGYARDPKTPDEETSADEPLQEGITAQLDAHQADDEMPF